MKKLLLILFSLTLTLNSFAEEVFYCSSELSTGLIMENGEWKTATYETDRFTIKFNDNYSTLSGLESYALYCEQAPGAASKQILICSPPFDADRFIFENELKRFMYLRQATNGYLTNRNFSTWIEAGTCQSF